MASELEIQPVWEDAAERLLAKNDRLMRAAIRYEFDETLKNPDQNLTEIDPALHLHTTPVAGRRYTVLWTLKESDEGRFALVKAVVPAEFSGEDSRSIVKKVNAFGMQELGREFDFS